VSVLQTDVVQFFGFARMPSWRRSRRPAGLDGKPILDQVHIGHGMGTCRRFRSRMFRIRTAPHESRTSQRGESTIRGTTMALCRPRLFSRNGFGAQVAAQNRTIQRGRQTCIRPITGQQEIREGALLERSKRMSPGPQR